MNYPLRTKDLPKTKALTTVRNRPLAIQLGVLIFSISIIIFFSSLWYIGAFFLLLSGGSMAVTKDYLSCMVYDDLLAIFNPKNEEELRIVKFEDILSYQGDPKAMSFVLLKIKNPEDQDIPEQIVISTFQSGKLLRRLRKLLPEGDANQQQIKSFQSIRRKTKDK